MQIFIGFLYKNLLKPFLFLFDPETIHDLFLKVGNLLGSNEYTREITSTIFRYQNKKLEQNILGIKFLNPVGLSAGFDKDAQIVDILPSVGFGFTQVGTVTYKAYEGNPKPRLTRITDKKSILVYYGLKNIGAKEIIQKLKKTHNKNFPISISIGKTNSKYTSSEKAGIKDYIDCTKLIEKANVGDFYTINISCPNTFGGEPFTTPKKLEALLKEFKKLKIKKPIFIKMPINLTWSEFDKLLKIILKYKLDGVIIGNLNKHHKYGKGGLSGKPTWKLSNELISKTYQKYGNKLVIIGVGGIFSAEDAYEKIKRGASLVQLITGIIYEGPQLIGQINKELTELLEKDGYKNISQVVGTY